MLQVINEVEAIFRLKSINRVTVFINRFFKNALVDVFELNDGEIYVFSISNNIKLDMFSENYIKKNNIEVKTKIPEGEKIVRMIEGRNCITGMKCIEIIELSNGKVMIEPLSKIIITETMNSDEISLELEKS